MKPLAALAMLLGSLGGCAWGPGEPFGEITATLDARWTTAAGRDAGGGWQRLASDYQVRVDALTWTTAKLVFAASGGGALAFDPAAPPAGYTLCHNGHCHAVDGRLVSYEDISAELSGGAPLPPVLELPTGVVDLIAGAGGELGCDGGPCAVGRGTIGRVALHVTGYAIVGAVRDGRVPARRAEGAFTATAELAAPVAASGELGLAVDRASPPRIALAIGVHPGGELFDDVDWAAVAGVAIGADQLTKITTAIGEVELALDVDRD